MEEATETSVSQEQIDEMERTVVLLADLTVAALGRGSDSWQNVAEVGIGLMQIQEALVESGMAPAPTPSEE